MDLKKKKREMSCYPAVPCETYCYDPALLRAHSLNPGLYERRLSAAALPDPRRFLHARTSLAQLYAVQLRDYNHLKDPNMRRIVGPTCRPGYYMTPVGRNCYTPLGPC